MSVNLSVKNVPDPIVESLRERARRNHRSLQGEVMAILEQAAGQRPLTLRELSERVRQLGLSTPSESVEILREARDAR